MRTNTLHVYTQLWQHSEVVIAGSYEALVKLRDNITEVLSQSVARGTASAHAVALHFANDGEGYDLHVVLLPTEELTRLQAPYIVGYQAGEAAVEMLARHGWLEAGDGC